MSLKSQTTSVQPVNIWSIKAWIQSFFSKPISHPSTKNIYKEISDSLSCGRRISPPCQWSPHWREGSLRSVGWSGSTWWSQRSSSYQSQWLERSYWWEKKNMRCQIMRGTCKNGYFLRLQVRHSLWYHKNKNQSQYWRRARQFDTAVKFKCNNKQTMRSVYPAGWWNLNVLYFLLFIIYLLDFIN